MSIVKETRDQISIQIDGQLDKLSHIPFQPYIFKVNDRVRRVNEKAYEPEFLAIGPYHSGKSKLKLMEGVKLRLLQQLLRRRNEDSVDKFVKAMRGVQERARGCYAEPISLSKDKFVKVLVLDGCFIIEWFRRCTISELSDTNDIFFQAPAFLCDIGQDLMLVENQLPFFVLTTLFDMTKSENPKDNIIRAALGTLSKVVPYQIEVCDKHDDIKHLVCLLHKCWCSPFAEMLAKRDLQDKPQKLELIRSATELKEAGVKFKKAKRRTLFEIRFSKGVMEIPCLIVADETDFVARNLIAYEQYLPDGNPTYITDYFYFIDCLVDSSKDVEILREEGIIDNWLGNDEKVAILMSNIGNYTAASINSYYEEIFLQVNKHCRKRCNRWTANLKHNYFNTPWASISVLAAAALLLLTVVQAIFSIIK